MSAAAAAAASLPRLSSTLKMEEETINMKKQGIGSILGSDSDQRSKSSSLRRTLSAEHMSSTKWLTHHGFSPMKKIASSEEFSVSSITDSEREDDDDDEEEEETQTQFDIWTSIQNDKNNKDLDLEKPYIHPLVKRSSSLSEKSLEICTESLGSETGSDVFSSYPSSETEDDKEINEQQQQQQQAQEMSFDVEDVHVHIPKYNYVVGNKKSCSQSRSFPPPIPSLLSREDGASIHMQSRRDNGRLVLEAVSVPTTNNFKAQRHDGRLVLTFIETHEQQLSKNYNYQEEEEEEDVFDNFEEEEEEEEESEDDEEIEENKEMEFVMERAPKVSTGVISLHRLTYMMKNKHLGVVSNKNPTWPHKFNEVAKFDDEEEIIVHHNPTMVAQSLPPMARLIPKPPVKAAATAAPATARAEAASTKVAVTGGAASLNAYEYYWRTKPESKGNNINGNKLIINSKNPMENYEQRRSSTGNKGGDYLVPLLKSCKEPRRSLLFWEPRCIATS
ncbi:hypothetical protein Ddye_022615 [Dipteronia dyeriana]|uniref:FAF domain-containing protein n=1 Tax=Dipteronia dyeriana TaxID=168575 RepID=A0AAD9TRF7_9ROSI|nr:hypothetical protein Ddye_022615 [Dipteronia dyeriana]